MRIRKAFLWSMIVSLAASAVMGIVAIIFDSFGNVSERVLATALLVSAFSMTSLAAAIVLDRRRMVAVSWTGIACSMLALGVWIIIVWFERSLNEWEEFTFKTGGTFTIAAVWCPHVGLLRLLRLDRPVHGWVRRATWISASLLALTIAAVIWTEEFEEWTGKTIAVLAILAGSGTAMTPVLAIIERVRRKDSAESIERRVSIDLHCPRCGIGQRIKAGGAKCAACGLRIAIDIEEPRCACGYLLYQLQGDACPECGRPIEGPGRWITPPPPPDPDPPTDSSPPPAPAPAASGEEA